MTDNIAAYKAWAPDGVRWAQWVKPVLFANGVDHGQLSYSDNPTYIPYERHRVIPAELPLPAWISTVEQGTMLIVDQPAAKGVRDGIALAKIGYRPVPLYNGVSGVDKHTSIVDVQDIMAGLFEGADILETLSIRDDAPPAFLLDSERMDGRDRLPGMYDNRWCVFPQDMPSAEYLQKYGIQKVVVYTSGVQNDLSHILNRYQERGIGIFLCTGESTRALTVPRPWHFKRLTYRFNTILKLRRNAAGGFGGEIPEPMAINYTGRYYGMG
ncbi:MAG: hypothetical protein LBN02_01490 [Oscillospiraceae bacterium]|jgi:hypothetical protein|nr:hypothetical protein [Oscillospiraceae bacterium]